MSHVLRKSGGAMLVAAALLATPGCISLLPETQPDQLYRLDARTAEDAAPAEHAVTVIIDEVSAPRGLAGDRIALQRDSRIGYIAGAAWLSPAPDMLHAMILDKFYAEQPAIQPSRQEDAIAARYRLDVDLRHFEAVFDRGEGAAPLVRVAIRARLIDREERSLVAARTVHAAHRASENRQGPIVDAFGRAAQDAASELAAWTAATVCGESEDC